MLLSNTSMEFLEGRSFIPQWVLSALCQPTGLLERLLFLQMCLPLPNVISFEKWQLGTDSWTAYRGDNCTEAIVLFCRSWMNMFCSSVFTIWKCALLQWEVSVKWFSGVGATPVVLCLKTACVFLESLKLPSHNGAFCRKTIFSILNWITLKGRLIKRAE